MKFLTPILLIVISGALAFWYISPGYTKIGQLREQLGGYEDALVRAQAATARSTDLVNKYNSFSPEQLEQLQKLLPDKIDNIRFLIDLNALSARYSSGIEGIRISNSDNASSAVATETESGPYGMVSVGFNVSMTYSNFQLFLRDIEQNLRLMDVTNVSFAPEESGIYSYSVTLHTYWLK